jgi:Tfp pilus assembly protein PilO
MAHLYECKEPQSFNQLYKVVQRDLPKQSMMPELIASLMHAGKIQEWPMGHAKGYLAKQKPVDDRASYVDLKLLKEARPR